MQDVISQWGWLGIVIAALGGAAIGVERQQSGHATGRYARFGGVRTFTLLGGIAGMAGWMTTLEFAGLGAVLAAGAVAIVIAGYIAASDRDVDATTEVAALVVIAAGVAAGLGWLTLASGMIAVTALALIEKSRLHALVRRIDDEDMRAAARFAVMAVVVLPLLPEGPFGPAPGIRPRALWLLVLFFSGLGFIGYIARRIFGAGHGFPIAGLLGGLISSTNVTLTFARLSRRDERSSAQLAVGAIAACTMLFPRVLVAAAALNVPVARQLWPYAAAPFVFGVAALALGWRKNSRSRERDESQSNPLHIVPALEMAALFQLVLYGVHYAGRYMGSGGLTISGAVLGLTDVDALTISMTTVDVPGGANAAARAIATGILSNSVLKAGIGIAFGSPRFKMYSAAAIGGMAAAIGLALTAWP